MPPVRAIHGAAKFAKQAAINSTSGSHLVESDSLPKTLEVRDLRTWLPSGGASIPILHHVSFDVPAGETVAIVGESGSGKSVTALSIMRLLRSGKVEGSVKLEGKELLTLSEREMRKVRGNQISMIFQDPRMSLNPTLPVGYQIEEVLTSHRKLGPRDARAEAIRLLEQVRIPSARARLTDYPHQLSGGMCQRVMIATAVACRPKLIIADEPTSGLDVTIQAEILNLLASLQKEFDTSLLLITHDLGVVAEVARQCVVMHEGRVVESAETVDFFVRPSHEYSRALLAAVPKLGSMSGKADPELFPLPNNQTSDPLISTTAPRSGHGEPRNVLQVNDLIVRFDMRSGVFRTLSGRVHAVQNISFNVAEGETLALVGESGCGKSTTGRALLGLVKPRSGSISIGGVDITRARKPELRAARRSIQMVFQDPFASLSPRQTVGAAVAEPLQAWGVRDGVEERVGELLRVVGLSAEIAHRLPHEFSGGQRQRICIARALALRPKLIVADEAVSALDVSVKAQICNLLMMLQREFGLSCLFISHDIAVVERMSHRVAVMYKGEIVEIGPRASIFGDPQHPYTQKLLAAVPAPDPLAPRKNSPGDVEWCMDSQIRSPDFCPPARRYREVSSGHMVMETATH